MISYRFVVMVFCGPSLRSEMCGVFLYELLFALRALHGAAVMCYMSGLHELHPLDMSPRVQRRVCGLEITRTFE
jgi:hypothetical protein